MKSLLVISGLALTVHSCAPPAIEGGFDSANPAAKMYAIEDAARQGDRAAVRRIIEQLDSDDPAVRALAIATLKRLTGETHGYRDFDPAPQRQEAIARWVQAAEADQILIQPEATGQATPDAPLKSNENNEGIDDHG